MGLGRIPEWRIEELRGQARELSEAIDSLVGGYDGVNETHVEIILSMLEIVQSKIQALRE